MPPKSETFPWQFESENFWYQWGAEKKTDLKKDLANMLFYTTEKNVWQGLCLGRAINVLFCYELYNFLILKSVFWNWVLLKSVLLILKLEMPSIMVSNTWKSMLSSRIVPQHSCRIFKTFSPFKNKQKMLIFSLI